MTEPLFSRLLVRLCSIGARTSHGRDLSFDSAALGVISLYTGMYRTGNIERKQVGEIPH